MSFTIENKVALVPGANRGIGKQIVGTILAKQLDGLSYYGGGCVCTLAS